MLRALIVIGAMLFGFGIGYYFGYDHGWESAILYAQRGVID